MDTYRDLCLHLDDIHHLFVAPETNPFLPDRLDKAGMEYIITNLTAHKLNRKLRLTV
jgi:hypothetical protein